MSQGDTKVSNDNVVDHVDSYNELVSRLASMTMSLENEKAKTLKLENQNTFIKNTCATTLVSTCVEGPQWTASRLEEGLTGGDGWV